MTIRRLTPTFLDKVWGTPRTEPWYPASGRNIGEVWFVAEEEPRLLVKFLFTSGNLSVQVHPPDSASGAGKTEMWHVLRADPGARMALGFAQPVDRAHLRAAALSGEIESLLRWFEPQPGDTVFVPAGTVHAIGAGLAICEIQQNTDLTYRLYDYGRPRDLHLDDALSVAAVDSHPGPCTTPELRTGCHVLADCPYFHTESMAVASDYAYPPPSGAEMLICVEGEGHFDSQKFAPGEVWVVPRDAASFIIHPFGTARLLRTFVPQNLPSQMLAHKS